MYWQIILTLFVAGSSVSDQSFITTSPRLANNIVARNFSGLTLLARYQYRSAVCRWNFENQFSLPLYGKDTPCSNHTKSMTCTQYAINGVNYVDTTFTLNEPIDSDLAVSIVCSDGYVTNVLRITVQGKLCTD